jgi:heptosyltransferase-2
VAVSYGRILVVQTAFLGDVVLTTPLLRELKRAHPESRLTVLTTPLGAATLAGLRGLHGLIAYDKNAKERGIMATLRLVRRVRRERFDLVIAAHRSGRTGILARASGARVRVGFSGAAGAWAYTERVPWEPARHAVHRYLALAGACGGDPAAADARPELAVLPEAQARIASLLAAEGIGERDAVLSIVPGSIWGTKRWTTSGFGALARAARALGLRPVLVGSPAEAMLCNEVAALAGGGVPVLAGRTGIPDLAALCARSRAVVTNDSGPGHVAAAVGTPVVAVFGPTVPAFGYTPFGEAHRIVERAGLECRPCDRHGPQVCPLGHHRCMQEIGADAVLEALRSVLSGRPGTILRSPP